MQLNAVKSSQAGIACCLGMFLHYGFDFMRFKRAWHVVRLHARIVCDHFASRQQGAGGNCFGAGCFDVMAANATAVHDLQNNQTTFCMHRFGYFLPTLYLFGRSDARLPAIGLAMSENIPV